VPNQLPDAHNAEFQDQLRASTPEAMPKHLPIANSRSRYSDLFKISMMVVDFQRMW
jgi:hypothetical protein